VIKADMPRRHGAEQHPATRRRCALPRSSPSLAQKLSLCQLGRRSGANVVARWSGRPVKLLTIGERIKGDSAQWRRWYQANRSSSSFADRLLPL
jgi:hypothetical protein